ncbi:MAG: hypothetical protein KKE20_06730, partial [Nanoarchaeota archaeon]|nr:hypothetical protein [Nanoarchaeota archaeon]
DDLDIGESMTFAYDLTALHPLDEDFYSKIIYFNCYENIDENSESISLKAEPYFDLRVNLVDVSYKNQPGVTDIDNWERKSSIYSGNDILLIADIVNIYGDNNTLDVPKLRFFFPSGVRYLGTTTMRIFGNSSDSKSSYIRVSPELTRIDDHYYTWSGTTRKDGQLFVIKLKAAEEGDHVIRVSGDFNKSGLPMIYDYSKLVDLEVKKDELVIGTSVEDGEEFSSGQLVYFSVYITNPNDNVNFTDVKVQVNSSLTGEKTFLINKLYATKYVDVINQYINMPTVTQTESILLKINVTYKTQFGEELNKVEQMSLRVNPLAPFRIIHEAEGVSVTDSGSLTVNHKESDMSLSISNELEKDIEGIVVTEYTGGISKESKISSKIFLLPKNIKTMIYQYKIDPPDLTTESNYTIRTYIQYIFEGQSYNASTEVLVKVKPKEMDIDVSKDVLEDNPSKGQIVHVNYEIENTEKEPIYDVILLFPRQYSTDLVGMTNYTIDQIRPGERISITNQERVRIKTDDSVKLEPTKIIFKDSLGNVFSDETTSRSLDIEDGYLATPALLINISAPIKAIQGEDFNAKIMISNVGKEATTATLQYGGRTEKVSVMPDSYNIMNLTYNLEGQGLVEIPRVFTSYDVEGFTYHTASDITEIYLAEKVEKKPVVIEEIVEPVPEEKKKIFNIKYLYLLGFIILVSLIILYIIKRPNKDEGFEFIEK